MIGRIILLGAGWRESQFYTSFWMNPSGSHLYRHYKLSVNRSYRQASLSLCREAYLQVVGDKQGEVQKMLYSEGHELKAMLPSWSLIGRGVSNLIQNEKRNRSAHLSCTTKVFGFRGRSHGRHKSLQFDRKKMLLFQANGSKPTSKPQCTSARQK
jgi:hypothetical protein